MPEAVPYVVIGGMVALLVTVGVLSVVHRRREVAPLRSAWQQYATHRGIAVDPGSGSTPPKIRLEADGVPIEVRCDQPRTVDSGRGPWTTSVLALGQPPNIPAHFSLELRPRQSPEQRSLQTGDERFDAAFAFRSNEPDLALALFDAPTREALLGLAAARPDFGLVGRGTPVPAGSHPPATLQLTYQRKEQETEGLDLAISALAALCQSVGRNVPAA